MRDTALFAELSSLQILVMSSYSLLSTRDLNSEPLWKLYSPLLYLLSYIKPHAVSTEIGISFIA